MFWRDDYRIWEDIFPLNCVERITIPHGVDTGIWLPDTAIVTADTFYELSKSEHYQVRVHSDGQVDFSPGGFIRFSCKINLNLFPFDSMSCYSHIEGWFYTTSKQIFDFNNSFIATDNFTQHEQWHLDDYGMDYRILTYPVTGNAYSVIYFKINLTRKSAYYLMYILVPSALMSTLEMITFVLPPNQTIRIEVSFICLLAYTMFQSAIRADLPKSSDQTPLLSIYITMMIIFIAFAITMQCIVMAMTTRASFGSKFPHWLKVLVNKKVWEELEAAEAEPDDSNKDEEVKGIEDKHHIDPPRKLKSKTRVAHAAIWKHLYLRTDNGAAIIYFTLVILTSIILLLVIPAMKSWIYTRN